MRKIIKTFFEKYNAYFNNIETNIFRNYQDALLGTVVLLVLPLVSLVFTFIAKYPTFLNFCFPIISISFAGIYDTYGRYSERGISEIKKYKLNFRILFDTVALIIGIIATILGNKILATIATAVLCIIGTLILNEVLKRLVTAIRLSSL